MKSIWQLMIGSALLAAGASAGEVLWTRQVSGEASGSHVEGVQEAAERQAYGYADALSGLCESQGGTPTVNVRSSCHQHHPAHWFSCFAVGMVTCGRANE